MILDIIMESANLHHHQLHQDHQLLVGSSTIATPSFSVGNSHALTSNLLLSHTNSSQVFFGDISQKNDIHIPNSLSNSNLQDLGHHNWLNNNRGNAANGCFISSSSEHNHHQNLANVKVDVKSVNSSPVPKFTDLPNSSNSSSMHENDEGQRHMSNLSEKLQLKTLLLSPNYHVDSSLRLSRGAFQSLSTPNVPFNVGAMLSIHGNTSQIHPTVNISNLSSMSSGFPGSMDVNLQALDLLSMQRPSAGGVNHSTDNNNPGQVEDSSQLGFTHMQQYLKQKQSINPENLSSYNNNGVLTEPKPPQPASKRPRGELRTSCPPFKVRKEKLGDRVAALQQLVAPFGKTDTASVLLEAIGYIKFLQNQVETLSVPYMKLSSHRKSSNSIQEVSGGGIENEEAKPDLGSRGLCLVPLSCTSYITNDGGGGIWPPHPPNFNPGF